MAGLIAELRKRNVIRVAASYVIVSWLIVQVVVSIGEPLALPDWFESVVIVLLGIGFPIAMLFAWAFELTPDGIKRSSGPDESNAVRSSGKLDFLLVAGLAVVVFVTLIEKKPAQDSTPATSGNYFIAVLPFEDMSPNGDQQYLGDGIAEEILNQLVQIPELNVIARTSSFSFKGQNVDIKTIASKLNAAHVLEGSVRKSGDIVRITAQLIEAENGVHLWSQNYDRPFNDVFAIQDEISVAVVEQLAQRLLSDTRIEDSISPEAYELYLQANHVFVVERGNTEVARERFQQVIELAPEYLPAWAGLARTYFSDWKPEGLERTREVVAHMASIAPDSSWANHFQGWIAYAWDGDMATAVEHYERAIAADPYTPPQTLRIVARLLIDLDLIDEGIAVARHNLVRDPTCEVCAPLVTRQILKKGYVQKARAFVEEVMEWQSSNEKIYMEHGLIWLISGEPEKALQSFENIEKLDQDTAELAKMLVLADLAPTADFETRFEEYRASNPDRLESIARIYAWSGNHDMAFEYIDRLIERRGSLINFQVKSDMYHSLHTDPRWQAVFGSQDLSGADLSHIKFDPQWPPVLQAVIDSAETASN